MRLEIAAEAHDSREVVGDCPIAIVRRGLKNDSAPVCSRRAEKIGTAAANAACTAGRKRLLSGHVSLELHCALEWVDAIKHLVCPPKVEKGAPKRPRSHSL